MAKEKHSREYFSGENNSGHYNFVVIDREILFCTNEKGKNVRSSLRLSLSAIGLYNVIKAHAIDKNFCFPSLLTLKEITEATKETLIKYIRELEAAGLVIVEKQPGNAGHPKNVYVIPAVEKERIRMEALIAAENRGRQIEPLTENGSQRSGKPTVIILTKDTNKGKLSAHDEKINFVWEDWEFLKTGLVRNVVTRKEYPVRKAPFSFPIDVCMTIDQFY